MQTIDYRSPDSMPPTRLTLRLWMICRSCFQGAGLTVFVALFLFPHVTFFPLHSFAVYEPVDPDNPKWANLCVDSFVATVGFTALALMFGMAGFISRFYDRTR